ncbi:MAG: hypothetical protein UR26_C0003G0024 [candidate division TM6 bacterium GW2011_GWF2_32_72]|nr:MAG: hypothetical protein UR26_C0003G0024 [candidate division TM6 bacterium GW2011_GWF2_32_72]
MGKVDLVEKFLKYQFELDDMIEPSNLATYTKMAALFTDKKELQSFKEKLTNKRKRNNTKTQEKEKEEKAKKTMYM